MPNSTEELTLHQQKYIEAIYELSLLGKHPHAHTKDIAEKLDIKMPSVTEALRNLQNLELINYKARKAVTLTNKGTRIGKELTKRHKAFFEFFTDLLGVDEKHSNDVACKVEHVIDKDIRERLTDFMSFVKNDLNTNDKNKLLKFKNKYN